ncbi:unnamed protein product [Gordionus sp. m RMFG-2023]
MLKINWEHVDCVCIDFDSTLCETESLDDLAEFLGKRNEVEQITKRGMEGELKFEDSLEKRMNILSINQNLYNQFLKQNKLKLTINSQKFIQFLKEHDIPVYIISGGFSDIIHSLVKSLGIKKEMIFANNIIFDKYGNYLDFDRTKMTSYSGGKGKVIQYLKDEFRYQNIYIIGDGVTDLEACPPANGFIGFGGNVIRENVKNRSKWFIYDFQELLEE